MRYAITLTILARVVPAFAERARVGVQDEQGGWQPAGVWYTAGSNTCVYSNPKEELGATQHNVQTSNRRFRDDEFLIGRDLTRGRNAIRVRVTFTPVNRELFPGHPFPEESAWIAGVGHYLLLARDRHGVRLRPRRPRHPGERDDVIRRSRCAREREDGVKVIRPRPARLARPGDPRRNCAQVSRGSGRFQTYTGGLRLSDDATEGHFELVGHRYLRIAHFLNLGVVKLVMDEDQREMIAVQITIAAGDEIEDVVIPIEDAGELCKQLLFQVAPHGPAYAKDIAEYARQNWPKRKDAA